MIGRGSAEAARPERRVPLPPSPSRLHVVKTVWHGRVSQAAARYGEHAPMAATCCNACRACVQTNLIAGVLAALVAVGASLARFARRFAHSG